MNVKYNVDTKVIYNIGDPLDHSIAPYLINEVYSYMNLNAVSIPAVIPKGKLSEFVEAAKLLGCWGIDLTSPHKEDIIPFLDACDSAARAFGCVNTVKIQDGRLTGIGLDGSGLAYAVEDRLGSIKGRRALILGGGSVAGLVAHEMCVHDVSSITIANRTTEKAKKIAGIIKDMHGVSCEHGPLEDSFLNEAAKNANIVIQCTSLGRIGEQGYDSYAFINNFPEDCFAIDVLYPETQFLNPCIARGIKTLNGQWMMLYQQIHKMKFHFGVEVPKSAIPAFEEAADVAVTLIRARRKRLEKPEK